MPFFARRRLQLMLDELSAVIGRQKCVDLLKRLEDKRVDQALPAEMELGLLWALCKLGLVEVEPSWGPGDGRPDAYTAALVPGHSIVIEIASPSDGVLSGESEMDGVARAISDCADDVEPGAGSYLYFSFSEESGYERGQYYRRRLAPADYRLSGEAKEQVVDWVRGGRSGGFKLRIVEPGLDVSVERTAHRQTRFHNVWSSMPAETHSLSANPLATLLKRKLKQLRGAPAGSKKFIFLADAGSTLLNRLGHVGERDHTQRRVSGLEIISHFVAANRHRIDGVVVFAPRRETSMHRQSQLRWAVSVVGDDSSELLKGLTQMMSSLPPPRYEGYQARSLFRQGVFSPSARGSYLGMIVEGLRNDMIAKVPARAFLDFMAGRITEDQFRRFTGEREGQGNLFKNWLDRGYTIIDVRIEPRSVDEDDDHLVLHFSDDPAARPLKLPG